MFIWNTDGCYNCPSWLPQPRGWNIGWGSTWRGAAGRCPTELSLLPTHLPLDQHWPVWLDSGQKQEGSEASESPGLQAEASLFLSSDSVRACLTPPAWGDPPIPIHPLWGCSHPSCPACAPGLPDPSHPLSWQTGAPSQCLRFLSSFSHSSVLPPDQCQGNLLVVSAPVLLPGSF